jgi:hypothetical protein
MSHTKGIATQLLNNIQIQIFQPMLSSAIPPANTVMKLKSHSPNAPAAPPT